MLSGPPERRYLIVFAIELCIVIGWAAYHEIVNRQDDGISGLVLRIFDRAESPLLIILFATVVIGEGATVLAERYLRHRYEVGKQEGIEEGVVKGRAEGVVKGREEIKRLIRERAKNGTIDVEEILRAIDEDNHSPR